MTADHQTALLKAFLGMKIIFQCLEINPFEFQVPKNIVNQCTNCISAVAFTPIIAIADHNTDLGFLIFFINIIVDTKEINPKTMESRLIKGLFFAGEVIDVDARTGGYNMQAAFSTGYLCGDNL